MEVGLEVAYQRAGEGPPLVLVHGAAEDGRVWQPQLAALADAFTVVAWDEPGAGRSSDVPTKLVVIPGCGHISHLEQHLPLAGRHRTRTYGLGAESR